MKSFNTYYDLVNSLGFGKPKALTSKQLYDLSNQSIPVTTFQRKLRDLANEARLNGNKVIGDDNGYYLAINLNEWEDFKSKRFASISTEVAAFAHCEHLTVSDLIKNIWKVKVDDPNYELF
jgi:hypothetical protein